MRNLQLGIVGTGGMANVHAMALLKIKGVEIASVSGTSTEKAARFANKYHIKRYFDDYNRMLDKVDLDALCIATPTNTHCQIAIDGFKGGCQIFCEKPISITSDEAKKMLSASEESKKILMIGYALRFCQEYQEAKRLIESGQIGDIKVAWFRQSGSLPQSNWYLDPVRSGGVTFELATHAIDWLRWMTGSEIDSLSAECRGDIYNMGKEDNVWVLLKLKNGAFGAVASSYSFSALPNDVGIIGTKKSIGFKNRWIIVKGHKERKTIARQIKSKFDLVRHRFLRSAPYVRQMQHFISCIRQGSQPIVTGYDGLRSLEVAEAVLKSCDTGERVKIK